MMVVTKVTETGFTGRETHHYCITQHYNMTAVMLRCLSTSHFNCSKCVGKPRDIDESSAKSSSAKASA